MENTARRPPVGLALLIGGVVIGALAIVFAGTGGDRSPSTTEFVPLTAIELPTTTTTEAAPTTAPIPVTMPEEVVPGWVLLDGGPLEPRIDPALVWTGREIVVVGGAASGGAFADGAAFTPTLQRWREIATPTISPALDPVGVWTGEEVIVFTTTDGAAYRPDADMWREMTPRPEEARHPVGAVWTGSEVVLVAHVQDRPRLSDELVAVAYDPAADTWRRLADPLEEMSYASVLLHEDRVVLVGGFLDQSNRARADNGLATAQAYDVAADSWSVLEGLDLPPNAVVAATTAEGILAWEYGLEARLLGPDHVWSETDTVPLQFSECYPDTVTAGDFVVGWYCGQAAIYLPTADAWVEITTPPSFDPEVFVPDELVAADDDVYFWGGDWDGVGGPFLWRFDPEGAATAEAVPFELGEGWRFLPLPDLRRRTDPSLVWTGEQLIAWGGHGTVAEVYDGFAYAPDSGDFQRIPDADYPGRFGQVAVWTGEEMFVWPAISAWSPKRAEWIPISLPGEAAPPAGSAAVWTGREVLLAGAGGEGDPGGVAYDPETDTWRALAPSPLVQRSEPATGWSGQKLYLWGGGLPDREFWYQDGAAYDPSSDEWQPLPPLPESNHLSGPVGAWSGQEFLVFGVAPQSTNEMPHLGGAAYDPLADRWHTLARLPLFAVDQKGLAGSLLAAWTGREMAVWMPPLYFGRTPQLGFYDPSADRWRLSEHLPFTVGPFTVGNASDMVFTGTSVAVLTDRGILLYDLSASGDR